MVARLCLTAPRTALVGLSALPHPYAKAEFYPGSLWCFSSVLSVGHRILSGGVSL